MKLMTPRESRTLVVLILFRLVLQVLDLLALAGVGLLGSVVASGLSGQARADFLGIRIGISGDSDVFFLTAAIVGVFVTKSALGILLLAATTRFLANVEADQAARIAEDLMSSDLDSFKRLSRGQIQWTFNLSAQAAFSFVPSSAATLVSETFLFVLIFLGFFVLDPGTAILVAAYFGLVVVLFQLAVGRRLRRLGERLATYSILLNQKLLDLTSAFREITVFGVKPFFIASLLQDRRGWAADTGRQRLYLGVPRFFVEVALMLGVFSIVAWQFLRGSLEEGVVVTAVILAGGMRMMGALLPMQNALNSLRIDGPRAEEALSLLEKSEERLEESGRDDPAGQSRHSADFGESPPIRVELFNVSLTYHGEQKPAIHEVSFQVNPGEFFALIGPSGAGKSTLADMILGLMHPTSGSVQLEGLPPKQFRSSFPGRVAYVPQRPGMVSGSIAENVALGSKVSEIDRSRVVRMLETVGMGDFLGQSQHGIDTDLGQQLDSLSGGQLQRIGIARALYRAPGLLVLDEATSALDADNEATIADELLRLRGTVSMFVIAHRMSTIQMADRIGVLDSGTLLGSGSLKEIQVKVPLAARYLRLSSGRS